MTKEIAKHTPGPWKDGLSPEQQSQEAKSITDTPVIILVTRNVEAVTFFLNGIEKRQQDELHPRGGK